MASTQSNLPNRLKQLTAQICTCDSIHCWGTIIELSQTKMIVQGLHHFVGIGDLVSATAQSLVQSHHSMPTGEVISVTGENVTIMLFETNTSLRVGHRIYKVNDDAIFPTKLWCGRVLNAFGQDTRDGSSLKGTQIAPLNSKPPIASQRRPLGNRLKSGLSVFNTLLPICKGQRLGLFAAAGVGKSTLMATLSQTLEADITVLALIGERGREVSEFADKVITDLNRDKTIIFAATSDDPAAIKRRAAFSAMACAEHFRRQGLHVVLLLDSLTRFADSHREIALSAGEPPSFRAYPPSLAPTIASFAERAGPGSGNEGDITAIFTILVSGDDHDEPVADITRGILDGHIILSRSIAERGRFPAIDLVRSVSRSLPHAANESENILIQNTRAHLSIYEENETLIKAGLYLTGSDAKTDIAINLWPKIDAFIGSESTDEIEQDFQKIDQIISSHSQT